MSVFEVGVCQDAVDEEQHCRREDQIVQVAPEGTSEACAEQRGDEDQDEDVERDGSGEVDERLQRRGDGPEDVVKAEVGAGDEKQHEGMGEGEGDGEVSRPLMEREDVDVAVGPVADGAVAEGHQHAEEEIDGGESDGAEAQVRAEIEESEAKHRVGSE